jgi:hypothetical protein
MISRYFCLLIFFFPSNPIVIESFVIRHSTRRNLQLLSSKKGQIERPANEFSRSYRIEGILSGGHNQRGYSVKIAASNEELEKLASRFELNHIYQLEAEVMLRREQLSSSSTNPRVQVEGMINARLDQVCVRTGEIFDVNVEFPLFAIVRPMLPLGEKNRVDNIPSEVMSYAKDQKGNKKNTNKKRDRIKTQNINDMDMGELQKLLQDFDVNDDVIEDDAIYSIDGVLDLGELVSQLFWLKLDPYPKKPGSNPIWTSISG